jgi:transposase
MHRGDLTEHEWQRLAPLLPQRTCKAGRPPHDHRRILNGILWLVRTGVPWRDLPERYGSWKTVSSRFYRWQKQGLWLQLLERLQQQADEKNQIVWDFHYADGSVIRAHQHAAGAKKGARKHLAARRAASQPRSTFEPKEPASPSPSC